MADTKAKEYKDTYTVTFGGQVENHVGMEKIGKMEDEGFSVEELRIAKNEFESVGCTCNLVNLTELYEEGIEAAVLVVRGGAGLFADPDEMYKEQAALEWDKKLYNERRKIVQNKSARWNLCYADFSQEPEYEVGKGRVVDFADLPCLSKVRKYLANYLGPKAKNLYAEGNYYYDAKKCGIGQHGDSERKIVVAFRLGATYPLEYQWFLRDKPVGKRLHLDLEHGDLYVMSEKATGWDWRRTKKIPTLRHAAGADKYLYVKKHGGKPAEEMFVRI
jgi:hypothetical protein